jgi:hypothetical protein
MQNLQLRLLKKLGNLLGKPVSTLLTWVQLDSSSVDPWEEQWLGLLELGEERWWLSWVLKSEDKYNQDGQEKKKSKIKRLEVWEWRMCSGNVELSDAGQVRITLVGWSLGHSRS